MLQLVYISSARRPLSDEALESLLAAARRNNRMVGVTGLLLASPRRFLQAIEGPEASVLAILDKIRGDDRHHAIVELGRRSIDARAFGSWDMAYERAGEAAGSPTLGDEVEALTATIDDANLRAQFTGFAQIHSRAA